MDRDNNKAPPAKGPRFFPEFMAWFALMLPNVMYLKGVPVELEPSIFMLAVAVFLYARRR